MKGRLITLEGGEGAGKSSALAAIRSVLDARGIAHVTTREPGGTDLGEAVRRLVLDPGLSGRISAESELLLMFAARAQLVREFIAPALERGAWVVSDRYVDASFAYQGGGRGQPLPRITSLRDWVCDGVLPDLTLLLDVPVEVGLARASLRGSADRIESEQTSFFERVRAGYRERAAAEPSRFRVIDAGRPINVVRDDVVAAVEGFVDGLAA